MSRSGTSHATVSAELERASVSETSSTAAAWSRLEPFLTHHRLADAVLAHVARGPPHVVCVAPERLLLRLIVGASSSVFTTSWPTACTPLMLQVVTHVSEAVRAVIVVILVILIVVVVSSDPSKIDFVV